MGKQAGEDGFLGDAAVADDANLLDCVGTLGKGRTGADQAAPTPNRMRCPGAKHGSGPARVREMEVCLIFTGLEPCDEHKCWCVPKIGFTGRICTPSLLKNLVLPQGKIDYI